MLDVSRTNSYAYTADAGGDLHDRFVLHFYKVATSLDLVGDGEVEAGNAIQIKSVGNKVMVSTNMELLAEGPGFIEIYSVAGSKLQEVPAKSSRTLVLLPSESGVYIVRARFGNLVKSERVLTSGSFE